MATSVVCDNAAVRGFELLKLSGNAEIDGERGRERLREWDPRRAVCTLVMRTHIVTIPRREEWSSRLSRAYCFLFFLSLSQCRAKSCSSLNYYTKPVYASQSAYPNILTCKHFFSVAMELFPCLAGKKRSSVGPLRRFILIVPCIVAKTPSGYMQGVCCQHTCGYMQTHRTVDMRCVCVCRCVGVYVRVGVCSHSHVQCVWIARQTQIKECAGLCRCRNLCVNSCERWAIKKFTSCVVTSPHSCIIILDLFDYCAIVLGLAAQGKKSFVCRRVSNLGLTKAT